MKKFIFLFPILAGISWGSVGIFVRKLTQWGMDSVTILGTRGLIATIILFAAYLLFDKSLLKIKLKDFPIFICSGIFGMIALNLGYNTAINELTLSFAAVLLCLAPMFVIIFSFLFLGEKITKRKIIALILAILGAICTSGIIENYSNISVTPLGVCSGLFAAISYATYLALSKKAILKGYNALTITFYSLVVMTVSLLLFSNWNITGEIIHNAPIQNTLFLVTHALLASVCPYVLHTYSLKYIDTGKAAILAESEPVSAMIFGIIFFAEVPTIIGITGLILILISLTLLSIKIKENN